MDQEIEKRITKQAWEEAIKEVTKKLENLPNNLQNIHTPFDFCRCIISKLKEYTDFENKEFCVFNIEFIEVLCYDFGIPLEKIWFLTDCREKAAICQSSRYKGVNVMQEDFFEILKNKDEEKKFDIIIGNPPYQDSKKKSTCTAQLWPEFVYKSFSIVKSDGYVILIHPPSWRKPENKLFNEFKERDLKYLEMHNKQDGMKIFKCSTKYDWYILKNSKYSGKTIVKDIEGKVKSIDISNLNFIPSCDFELFFKLLAKDNEEKCEVMFSYSSYDIRKPYMSKNKNDEFKYPCIYMMIPKNPVSFIYSNTKNNGHFGIPKIIINIQGTICCFIDDKGEYGMAQWAFGIKISSKEEGENMKNALMSEKFKKIWNATDWLSMTREWKIFKYFKKDFWKEFT